MIEAFEIEGGITLRGYRTSGSRPGPHVLITAGIHGSEYPGILAARKLRAFLSQADIAGTVTVLPLCNPTALKERAKAIFPEDGKNLNRMFPEPGRFCVGKDGLGDHPAPRRSRLLH